MREVCVCVCVCARTRVCTLTLDYFKCQSRQDSMVYMSSAESSVGKSVTSYNSFEICVSMDTMMQCQHLQI